jgi:hypothetical protein
MYRCLLLTRVTAVVVTTHNLCYHAAVNSTEQGPLRCARAARSKSNAGSCPSSCSAYVSVYVYMLYSAEDRESSATAHSSWARSYAVRCAEQSGHSCAGVSSKAVRTASHSVCMHTSKQPVTSLLASERRRTAGGVAQLTRSKSYCHLCINLYIVSVNAATYLHVIA